MPTRPPATARPAPAVRVVDGLLVWSLVAALALAGGWAAFRASERAGYASLADAAAQQLELVASGLDIEIARHEHLPSLMELNEDVLALLRQPQDAALRARVNRQLTNVIHHRICASPRWGRGAPLRPVLSAP